MKRLFLCVFSFVFLLYFCACADQRKARIRENLALPLEFNAAFTLGDLTGKAHFVVKETELNFGISEGDLNGLVAHITPDDARFLYCGMDLNFPAAATQSLCALHEAFLSLQDADLKLESAQFAQTLSGTLSSEHGEISVSFDPQTYKLTKLTATLCGTEIVLQLQE